MFRIRCATCGFEDARDSLDAVFELQEAHQERLGNDHFIEFETRENHSTGLPHPDSDTADQSVFDMMPEPTVLVESLTSQLRALAEHYDEDESGIIAQAIEQGLEEMSQSMVLEQYESSEITHDEVAEALGRDAISDLD